MALMFPKSAPVRDASYRRWVSTLPCINCGAVGRSQAAHGPSLGRSIKADDRTCVPLCADGPGFVGCHTLADQYRLFGRHERAEKFAIWAKKTKELWDRQCATMTLSDC